jgi:lauroyl/myristoyl acyltransferase
MAKLPLFLGHIVSQLRGKFNAWAGRDWAELSVGFPYIKERTEKASKILWPCADAHNIAVKRYVTIAREEWHAAILQANKLPTLKLNLDALHKMLSSRDRERGLVVLTAHFDSFIVGMVGLGLCGERVSVTTSNVYQNNLVHPSVTDFFDRKYRSAEKYFQGGAGFVIVEKAMRHFYRALKRRETVVVVADAPSGEKGRGIWMPWFGKERLLAEGGVRLAMDSNSQACAMLCVTQTDGSICWLCSDIVDPQQDALYAGKLYHFLEEQILAHPGCWWAAHLLDDYPIKAENSA